MAPPCTRHFLGWDSPALPNAAQWLIDQFHSPENSPDLDLGQVTLVVPGSRGGRLLLGLLVEHCQRLSIPLTPPVIITPKELPASMLGIPGSPVSWITSRQIWANALQSIAHDDYSALFPKSIQHESWPMLMGQVKWIQSIATQLADGGFVFEDVINNASQLLDESELKRWNALINIQDKYFSELRQLNLVDEQCQPLRDVYQDSDQARSPKIVLVGLAQLSAKTRLAIESAQPKCDSLIFAPSELAEQFDELGCIQTADWLEHIPNISEEQIIFTHTHRELCEQALIEVATYANQQEQPLNTSQCSIGIADETLIGPLKRIATNTSSEHPIHIHAPFGQPIVSTPPYRLLKDIQQFISSPTLDSLGKLIRNQDINRALGVSLKNEEENLGADNYADNNAWWVDTLDQIREEHAVYRSLDIPIGVEKELADRFQRIVKEIQALLKPLYDLEATQALDQWMSDIQSVFIAVYPEMELNPETESDRRYIDGLRSFNAISVEFLTSPMNTDSGEITAKDAINLVIERASEENQIDEIGPTSIEAIGWLELALDPSELSVVIGMTESCVPGSITYDPILPGALRNQLGMLTNNDRLARDLYLISLINASRKSLFMCARVGTQNDPLIPSRLLLRATSQTLANRVMRFADPPINKPIRTIRRGNSPGTQDLFQQFRRIPDDYQPPESMGVTDFDTYLRSPAQWLYQRRLGLKELDTSALELSARHIGSLIHTVLEEFGQDPDLKKLTQTQDIQRALHHLLDQSTAAHFGRSPSSTVKVQIKLLQQRLTWIAQAQSKRRLEGWSLIHTEWSPLAHSQSALIVDGEPIQLRGKIDRIDRHEDGSVAIIDYKSGKHIDARKAHLTKDGWKKLQLPLYRTLTKDLLSGIEPELGYACIPSSASESTWSFAQWSVDELDSADLAAAQIVREIRAYKPGDLIPLGDKPSCDGIFGFLTGERFNTGGHSVNHDTEPSETGGES